MRLHVLSDTHLEFHADGGKSFIESLNPGKADALVLAGDILSLRYIEQAKTIFEKFCDIYPHVFYVPGNHEFYRTTPQHGWNMLLAIGMGISNLSVLNGEPVEFKGRRFIGGTLWFSEDPMNKVFRSHIADFGLISNLEPWVYQENRKFLLKLANNMRSGDIVVTHHLPSPKSTPARFTESCINRFFVCEAAEDLLLQKRPALWIHGHTHDSTDYRLGDTRVYCNPLGYPREGANPEFDSRIELEV